jgi:hypothetical protein
MEPVPMKIRKTVVVSVEGMPSRRMLAWVSPEGDLDTEFADVNGKHGDAFLGERGMGGDYVFAVEGREVGDEKLIAASLKAGHAASMVVRKSFVARAVYCEVELVGTADAEWVEKAAGRLIWVMDAEIFAAVNEFKWGAGSEKEIEAMNVLWDASDYL